ncbi:Hypothetical protein VV1_1150 [Vibrio vulnificus CMCP6]|uniref:Uncharacterized protein n=1 Tax=Vibrio vulnificus (strain CMCP6) TaxID=216895 RepID=A0A3Q0L3A9_VIBVU|nr:Hypothetical protein VV1_1150 [Vibrio vulnificus CMCP6]
MIRNSMVAAARMSIGALKIQQWREYIPNGVGRQARTNAERLAGKQNDLIKMARNQVVKESE